VTPEQAAELDATLARGWTDVRTWLDVAIEMYAEQGYRHLGFDQWGDYCHDRGFVLGLQLPREERREIVADLTEQGMSTRAIGSALGVSDYTVRNDQGARNIAPGPVTGLDGKAYQPRPPKPTPQAEAFIEGHLASDPAEVLAYVALHTGISVEQLRTIKPAAVIQAAILLGAGGAA
jgi:transposase